MRRRAVARRAGARGASHVSNTRRKLIPMGETLQEARMSSIPAKETIVVCFSGERSAHVTLQLRSEVFDKAYNLTGRHGGVGQRETPGRTRVSV